MPQIGSYDIAVVVNGHKLREHKPPTDEPVDNPVLPAKKKEFYVEALEGESFEIKIKVQGRHLFGYQELRVSLYLDKTHVKPQLFCRRSHRPNGHVTTLRIAGPKFLQNNRWVECPFVFKNLPLQTRKPKVRI